MEYFSVKIVELTRYYGKVCALDRVSIEIKDGELFGLLGPNGAGKTTLIRILTTLLLPTSGKAYIKGFDVEKDYQKIRRIINLVSGGEEIGYGILTLEETLWLFSQLYGVSFKEAKKRINELVRLLDLEPHRKKRVSRLSTGLRQRMNIARGFINDPEILFLDEPTMGLDVESAILVRRFIKNWVKNKKGRTVLLTTHNMFEAEELCDRIAIINKGKIFAIDTPSGLKKRVERENLYEFEIKTEQKDFNFLKKVKIFDIKEIDRNVKKIKITLSSDFTLDRVINEFRKGGSEILLVKKIEPTLEEAFIKIVGMSFEEAEKGI